MKSLTILPKLENTIRNPPSSSSQQFLAPSVPKSRRAQPVVGAILIRRCCSVVFRRSHRFFSPSVSVAQLHHSGSPASSAPLLGPPSQTISLCLPLFDQPISQNTTTLSPFRRRHHAIIVEITAVSSPPPSPCALAALCCAAVAVTTSVESSRRCPPLTTPLLSAPISFAPLLLPHSTPGRHRSPSPSFLSCNRCRCTSTASHPCSPSLSLLI